VCVWLCGSWSWWVVVVWVWAGGWVVCVWCWGGGYVVQETATATAVTRQQCGEWCAGRRRRKFWLILAYLEHNQKARQIVIYLLYPTISDYIRLYPTISHIYPTISHHIPPYRNWDTPKTKIHSRRGLLFCSIILYSMLLQCYI